MRAGPASADEAKAFVALVEDTIAHMRDGAPDIPPDQGRHVLYICTLSPMAARRRWPDYHMLAVYRPPPARLRSAYLMFRLSDLTEQLDTLFGGIPTWPRFVARFDARRARRS